MMFNDAVPDAVQRPVVSANLVESSDEDMDEVTTVDVWYSD